jgi:hypothetical protein
MTISQVVNASLNDKRYAKRHHLFLEANRQVKKPSILGYDNAWGSMDTVTALAKGYLKDIADKTLVLLNHVKKDIKFLPYLTRFDDDYAKRIARKWKRIGYREGIFLTLTLDPKRFCSFDQAYRAMINGWNKISTAMRKNFPEIKGYARVVELQESGNPHLHVLIFGADFIAIEWIRKLWEEKYQLGTQIKVKKIENDKGAIRYLLKYLLKAFKGKTVDENDRAFSQKAMLWAVNSRGWAVSGNLISLISQRLIQTNGCSDWVFVGAFPIECVKFSYFEFLVWVGFDT